MKLIQPIVVWLRRLLAWPETPIPEVWGRAFADGFEDGLRKYDATQHQHGGKNTLCDCVVCVNQVQANIQALSRHDKADRKRSQKARQVLLWKAFFACKGYRQVERVTHADKMVARGQMTEHERTQRRWWAMSFGLPSVGGRSTYLFETDVIKWLSEPPRWKGKAASDVR